MKRAIFILMILMFAVAPLDARTIKRNETVYVTLDAYGKAQQTEVVTWLRTDGDGPAVDAAELDRVESVRGRKVELGEDGRVVFDTLDRNVFYRGYTSKELPVSLDISYTLDGSEISHADLAGKDGRLGITIRAVNNARVRRAISYTPMGSSAAGSFEEEINIPFMTIAGMTFGVDKIVDFDTVVAEGAMSFVVGSNMTFVWMTLPSPEAEMKIEIDMQDIAAPAFAFALIPDLPEIPIPDDVSRLGELYGGIGEIAGGIKRMQDGLYRLSDGQKRTADGVQQISDGTGQLAQLASGHQDTLGSAMEANRQIVEGITPYKMLIPRSGLLLAGLDAEYELVRMVCSGGEISEEMRRLAAENGREIPADLNEMPGLDTSVDGLEKISDGAAEAADGLVRMADGTRDIADGLGRVRVEGLERIQRELKSNMGPMLKQLAIMNASRQAAKDYDRFAGLPSDTESAVQFIIRTAK